MTPYIDKHNKCPSNHNNLECSAHGVIYLDSISSVHNANTTYYFPQICSNLNQCFCDNGWTGNDCSIQLEISPTSPNSADVTLSPEDAKKAKSDLESKMIMKETPYGKIQKLIKSFVQINTNITSLHIVMKITIKNTR